MNPSVRQRAATLPAQIYLDYAATTPVDPQVRDAMLSCLDGSLPGAAAWSNAASTHAMGRRARKVVERARSEVAALINARADEIIFTSGATESNNLAIKGAVEFNRDTDRIPHIITARTEHRSVIDSCRWLGAHGTRVTWLVPASDGRVAARQVLEAVNPDTLLVSLMWVNNETGAVQDIARLARQLRARGVLLHVDAVQAAGKIAIDVERIPIDLLSISAHKLYGPKGIGVLFVRRRPRVRVAPQLHGGGQEQGMRSGTLPNHQIVAMGAACRLAGERLQADARRCSVLRENLWAQLAEALPQIFRNGPDPAIDGACAPHILNLSFAGVDGEALRASLPRLAVSSGSACTAADGEPSFVLRALGRDDVLADASLRFSLGRTTSQAEIDEAARAVSAAVRRLRALSPLWTRSSGTEAATTMATEDIPPNPFDYPLPVWKRFWQSFSAGDIRDVAGTVHAAVRTPAAHAVLELSARLVDGRVEEARFRAFGNPCVIAVGAWLAGRIRGLEPTEVVGIKAGDIRGALEIDEPHLYCALLGEDAVSALVSKLQGVLHYEPVCE